MKRKVGTSTRFRNGVPIFPGAKKMKAKTSNILGDRSLSKEEKATEICQLVVKFLSLFGRFGFNRQGAEKNAFDFMYCLHRGDILSISKQNPVIAALVLKNFGISSASQLYNYLMKAFEQACFMGEELFMTAFTHYDREGGILYLPKAHGDIIVCHSTGINIAPNGTNGIYISNSGQFANFEYTPNEVSSEQSLIQKLLFANLNCKTSSRRFLDKAEAAFILEILLYFIPLSGAMETRPIIIIHGPKGSGKSSLLKRIGKALFGPAWNLSLIPRSRRDLETEFANNSLCCFDNVDRQLKKPLRDAFAAITTGSGYRARKLFTDSTQKSYCPRPMIAITTRNPSFSMEDDDIIDRSIIVNLEPLSELIPENELVNEITARRNAMLSEMLSKIPEIIKALRDDRPIKMNRSFRLADFANFAYRAAYPIFRGRMALGDVSQMLDNVFKKIGKSQRTYLLTSPLHFAVDEWVSQQNNFPQQRSTKDLFEQIQDIDKDEKLGLSKVCNNKISFGILMTNNEKIFAERYGYERTVISGNKAQHTFNGMKTDPILI